MNRRGYETGAILPLVAIAMLGLFGVMALALDVGLMMWRKSQMHTAIDAAALSAAHCRFIAVMDIQGAEACGTETFRYNLRESGLDDSGIPSYQWPEGKYYVDVSATSPDLETILSGVFARMTGGGSMDVFSVFVSGRAGLTGLPTSTILPLVVDSRTMCTKHGWLGDCTQSDYKSFPVRAWGLLNRENSGQPGMKTGELFNWLAGGKGLGISFNTSYELCMGDRCDKSVDYESAIEQGLSTRFGCELDDDNPEGMCGDDDFPYFPEEYPPDTYVSKLNSGNDYQPYFIDTKRCDTGNGQAGNGCWKPDDKHNSLKVEPEHYRRVVMAGIGKVTLKPERWERGDFDEDDFTGTAQVLEAGCFILYNEVDDPEDWDEHYEEGIWLKYIPPGSEEAQAHCQYDNHIGPARLVLFGEK